MISYGKIKWGYRNPWYNTHCKRILNRGKLYGYVTKTDKDKHCYSNGQLIEITCFTDEYEYAYCVRVSDKLQQLIPVEHFSKC